MKVSLLDFFEKDASHSFVTWYTSNALRAMTNNLYRTTSNFILFTISEHNTLYLLSLNSASYSMVFSSFDWMEQWIHHYFMMTISPQPTVLYVQCIYFTKLYWVALIMASNFAELVCPVRYKCQHYTWHALHINHFVQLECLFGTCN